MDWYVPLLRQAQSPIEMAALAKLQAWEMADGSYTMDELLAVAGWAEPKLMPPQVVRPDRMFWKAMRRRSSRFRFFLFMGMCGAYSNSSRWSSGLVGCDFLKLAQSGQRAEPLGSRTTASQIAASRLSPPGPLPSRVLPPGQLPPGPVPQTVASRTTASQTVASKTTAPR